MTAEARPDLQHRDWCRDRSAIYWYDNGVVVIMRCRDCRAELVRHRRPGPPDDDEPGAA